MIVALLLAACPKVYEVNKSGFPWNEHDKETKNYCQKRCTELYEDAPCLKLFKKYDKMSYTCLCGK